MQCLQEREVGENKGSGSPPIKFHKNKVSLQTSLERNPTNSSYIFILSVNFENLIVRLHVLITSLILTKFQENQRSIVMSSNKCYNFKFL